MRWGHDPVWFKAEVIICLECEMGPPPPYRLWANRFTKRGPVLAAPGLSIM